MRPDCRNRLATRNQSLSRRRCIAAKSRLRTALQIPADRISSSETARTRLQMLMLATARPGATVLSVARRSSVRADRELLRDDGMSAFH